MGVVWSILLFFFASDSPSTQKGISKKEKEYILAETEKTIQTRKICQSVNLYVEIYLKIFIKT